MIQSESFDNSRAALRDSLSVLNSRERRIFEARRIAEKAVPFDELAREFGVSREHVRPHRGARVREGTECRFDVGSPQPSRNSIMSLPNGRLAVEHWMEG